MTITDALREKAKGLLESGEIKYFIGWEKGTFWYQSPPAFIDKPEEIERLIWDEFCSYSLARYAMRLDPDVKIGLAVKGCDSRGINRLINDNQLNRDQVVLIGIPCEGMKDANNAVSASKAADLPMEKKCQECTHPNPVIYDVMLNDPVSKADITKEDIYKEVDELEQKSPDEKYQYWSKQYEKCIRCYACRNTCPACNCRECYVDQYKVGWQNKAVNLAENQMFHITRAMHVAGRCVECGECERVCPVGVPLMKLNKKLAKDINELFGEFEAGVTAEEEPPLGKFNTEDPEEFM
ncbi:ferredoxin [Desulfitispora alkaliphila]|uniref:4Fe-4S dicluster domain-containing protein n=1 Tax=Desulfitispora alkaliphila TaxID=622674 RepID=UPI003D203B2A